MFRLSLFLLLFGLLGPPLISGTQAQEIGATVSPYTIALRSAVVPGWGQFRLDHPVQGILSTALVGGALTGALLARTAYLDVYNDEYLPVARINPESAEALDAFARANQRFKLSQFFAFTALGVWAYAVVDSYVSAHVYNAELKASRLDQQAQPIEMLELTLEGDSVKARLAFHF